MNVDDITKKFLKSIQNKVSTAIYSAWFKSLQIMYFENATATIYIDSDFKKKKILNNSDYSDLLESSLKEVTGKDYTFELITDFKVEDEINNNINETINNTNVEEPTKEETKVQSITINTDLPIEDDEEQIRIKKENQKLNNHLNKDLRFDNYMLGEANSFAHMNALQVAKNPGKTFNPFFIYGRSGTGKTHLMHAIGNYIVEHSDKSVLYIRSDEFISDFIEMTRKSDNSDNTTLIQKFKEKYQDIDVLIVDDIQMLRDATKSKDEFFKTWDSLKSLNKQIIISSDTSPNDLSMFEDRLKTRFYQGITVEIKPPDRDLKIKILKNKVIGMESAELLTDEIFDYIADNSPSDVRSLEGAINTIFANIVMWTPTTIDIEFVKNAISPIFGSNQYLTNNLARIRKTVAEYYDVTEESLKSKKRQANINKARQVAMYISSIQTNETVERIGLQYNRDHATVLHGCEKIGEELKTNKELEKEIKEIRDKLTV